MKQNLACLGFACVWGTSYSPSGQPGKMRVRELFGFTGVQAKFTGNWDTGFWTILRCFPQPCPLKRLPNRYIVYSLGHVDNICRHINSRTKWAVDTDCPLGYLLVAVLAFFWDAGSRLYNLFFCWKTSNPKGMSRFFAPIPIITFRTGSQIRVYPSQDPRGRARLGVKERLKRRVA